MKSAQILFLSALFTPIVFTSGASAASLNLSDFSNTSGLTLNGNATTTTTSDGSVLRLTPATTFQSGSAFSTTTINASQFSTFFKFRFTNPGGPDSDGSIGADGLVFVAQSVSSSAGGAGGGIGYSGIFNSVGVEFDTWRNTQFNDPSSNHIGININGNVNHGSGSPNTVNVASDFNDGNIWYAWVDYNGTTLEVRANQTGNRPSDAILSRNLDLTSILGQTTAYVGFTSGTGGSFANHDILSWEYRDEFDPIDPVPTTTPEPSTTVALFSMLGLGTLLSKKIKK